MGRSECISIIFIEDALQWRICNVLLYCLINFILTWLCLFLANYIMVEETVCILILKNPDDYFLYVETRN